MKGISKKDFDEFQKEMWKRLKKGEEKYGCKYKTEDIQKAILEEATDLSNYAFMLYLKVKEFNKHLNNIKY